MKFAGHCLLAATLLASVAAGAQETQDAIVGAEKPYASIVARNMFALIPIPPPPTNDPAANVEPPPKITPNGIMTIFGRVQALFKVAGKPKPGQPPKDDSYILSEGERQDEIEVVKINEAEGKITFNNHGVSQELALIPAKDVGSPGGPGGMPGGGPRMLGGNPALGQAAGNRQLPPAMMRGRVVPGMNPGFNGGSQAQPASASPGLGSNLTSQQSSQPANIEDQVMNAAKEMAQIELNRIQTQSAVDAGLLPPLPPTSMTPADATAHDGYPLISPNESMPVPVKK